MAIIKMKKLTAIVLKQDTEKFLSILQDVGAVEISQIHCGEEDLYKVRGAGLNLTRLENELSEVRFAIGALNKHDKSKKPSFFSALPPISLDGLKNCKEKGEEAKQAIKTAREIDEKINIYKHKITRIIAQIAQLEPYKKLNIPISEITKAKYTSRFIGFLPKDSLETVKELPKDFGDMVYIEQIPQEQTDKKGETDLIPLLIVAYSDIADEVLAKLKEYSFSESHLEGFKCTCAERIDQLKSEISEIEEQQKAQEALGEQAAVYKPMLQAQEDFLLNEIIREEQYAKFGSTSNADIIKGWVRIYQVDKVKELLDSVTNAYFITFEDPTDDDDVPTAEETNKLGTPFQGVVDLYDTPNYRELDPAVILAPFYFVFFGMMLSDAGYGAVLTIFSIVYLKSKKLGPERMSRKVIGTVGICGISTIIWGLLFGTVFGLELTPLWFAPMENPLMMLILCIAVGFIHLMVSLIVGMKLCFSRGDIGGAIFDRGFWLAVLASVPIMLLNMNVGLVVLFAALIGVLFTAGRHRKGFGKVIGGLSGVYGITGYLSDILSYARLFGMSLATGVIAMVFNTIGGMVADSGIIGIVFAVIIIIIGQTFNMGINALGSFVHSCRLQYIESFPKFFEGGGRRFKPLGYRLKNYRIEN